ncbi:MAG: molybdate ABC transporter substrate-binding protein [Planctomycetes bacterium]|nr:molybdate ABC transporter substrate-binding protein [Planctomycetota bacterium]
MKSGPLLLLLAVLVALPGCTAGAEASTRVRVFAASSLTASFTALAAAFREVEPELELELHFAGTPTLVLQIREGAPVDVFASADETNMDRLAAQGRLREPPLVFARNRLAIVTAPGNPRGVRGLADLAREDLVVVLAGPEVPAGRYARQLLRQAGVEPRSRSDEASVQAVVNRVALGEADAGIAYVTDLRAAGARVEAIPIADGATILARYPVALLEAGSNPEGGRAFIAFLRSERGQAILAEHGFLSP